ncbi:glutamine--fructose-6-phosphate transaminase (isomerizing) [Pararhodobacter zhoushanensis]|uniref:Glutamine--fructose-6-phosphate aminotransferase [isomerizing] n=1 Tax=Pararhodobacter zhoushanensis TaxID=2479545 RepID=A0ABT3H3C5_9RHOB|nr:glutamine--fructose-6-phosphate transaminase (isomerizing) [Pararhodobacter zhoushanensis]MCW1934298.1 glutamine--fructose-6-phosphate transaminase (isomerizing) [Pararhodobacter zhoushanensis]
MCGIVGVLGSHEVAPLILESLKRLEYRGYDSAGIATVNAGVLDRRRAVGKLVNLSDLLVHDSLAGKAGIGHTRWATHGEPNVGNAHPHRSGPVSVVHNGIIENFRILREELAAAGLAHETDTDTETVALLTRHLLDQGMTPQEAVGATLKRLEGAFALAFLFEGHDDLMIGARKGSPLAVGHGTGEMYLGSDAIALAPMTDLVTYLEEGDWVVLTRAGATFYDMAGNRVNRSVTRIQLEQTRIDKAGHKHFMAKEIAEQPAVLGAVTAFHLAPDGTDLAFPPEVDFSTCDRVTMVACGTGHYATQVAKYWFEQIAGLPCDIDIASEFRYRQPVLSDKGIGIFVSQSGETADTLAALRHVEGKLSRTIGVVNVPTSSIARETDVALPILAGPEISVASTKGFTAQLLVLLLMALKAAQDRGRLDAAQLAAKLADIKVLPGLLAQALDREDDIKTLAAKIAESQHALFLGRGVMFPLALEAALKLKELSYIHAEGYASGELKHGPIALIDKTMPVIVLAPRDALYDKTVSNMQEVMARQGLVVLISDRAGLEEAGKVWAQLAMPTVPELIAPIVYAVPAQLLAYHTALARGTDVDQPRNLAKSVTVE